MSRRRFTKEFKLAAVRRSELVALDVADLEFIDDDLVIMLKRSKTHQEGEGRKVG